MRAASEEERRFWRDAIAGFRTEDEDLAHAVGLISRHDAVSATRERARHFADRAIDAIAGFPASAAGGDGRSGPIRGGAAVLGVVREARASTSSA